MQPSVECNPFSCQISRERELDEVKKEYILLSNDEDMHLPPCHYSSLNLSFFLITVLLFFSCMKYTPVIINTQPALGSYDYHIPKQKILH